MLAVTLSDTSTLVVAAAGGLAVLAGLARATRNLYRWCRHMETILTYVESEIRFNGGATMRDAIGRIERHLNFVDDKLETIETEVTEESS